MNDTLEKVLVKSLKLFPSEERFKLNKLRLTNGNFIIELANNALIKATALFDKKWFYKKCWVVLNTTKLLPEDAAYLENAGHAYYMSNQNNKAMKLFDCVRNH